MTLEALVLALALSLSPAAHAAPEGGSEARTHGFDLALGVTAVSRMDRQFSPLRATGVLPRIGLGYSHRGAHVAHTARLGVALGGVRSQPDYAFTRDGDDRSTGASPITKVDLRYAAGGRIDRGAWTVHVGGTLSTHVEDMVFANGLVGASHYFGAFELGPWVDAEVGLGGRHHLGLEGWAPVTAWVSRNPYSIHDADYNWNTRDFNVPKIVVRHIADGSLTTLNRYQAGHARLSWTVDLHDRWALSTRARLDAFHDSVPFHLTELALGADVALRGRI